MLSTLATYKARWLLAGIIVTHRMVSQTNQTRYKVNIVDGARVCVVWAMFVVWLDTKCANSNCYNKLHNTTAAAAKTVTFTSNDDGIPN